jgi:hypothetical protein
LRYRLVYTRRAERDIQGLDPDIKDRLGKALLRYEEDPLKHAEKLTQPPRNFALYALLSELQPKPIAVLPPCRSSVMARIHTKPLTPTSSAMYNM